jgi:pimeloyl-ACP methyl ester carboxylesterase
MSNPSGAKRRGDKPTREIFDMPSVNSADGTTIGYDISGRGPLLIAVAGATQYRAVDPGTAHLASLLAADFQVVIYDRRGRGASSYTEPYAVAREVEDIAALITAHGGRACLYGMSSGAVLALEAAAALGDRVEGLVLYEPPIDPARSAASYEADRSAMAALEAQGKGEDMLVDFLSSVMPPEALDGFRASSGWPAFAAVGKTILHDYSVLAGARATDAPPERWADISAPVLVLDGDKSFAFMKSGADWVSGGLRNVQRRTLAGQDHGVAPDVLAPILVDFLKQR